MPTKMTCIILYRLKKKQKKTKIVKELEIMSYFILIEEFILEGSFEYL